MTYERFEDLPVWNEAIRLAEGVDDLLRSMSREQLSYSKRDQIERCSLSVSNNIAEGFERGTTPDLLKFIYIARGSAAETRSMLILLERRPYLSEFRTHIIKLQEMSLSCSKQLRAWAAQKKSKKNTRKDKPGELERKEKEPTETTKLTTQLL